MQTFALPLGPWIARLRTLLARPERTPRPARAPSALTLVDPQIEWETLAGRIESRADRVHAIAALQKRSRQSIEAAEYALDRLIADCAAVLLPRDRPAFEPASPALAEAAAETDLPAKSLAA